MAKLFKKLKKTDKLIAEKQAELKNAQDPLNGYYLKIGTESERQQEIFEVMLELQELMNSKYSILENLQLEIEKEKVRTSGVIRKFIIPINDYERRK